MVLSSVNLQHVELKSSELQKTHILSDDVDGAELIWLKGMMKID